MATKMGVPGLLLATLACLSAWPASAQDERSEGLGDDDRFEGKPYPACLEASEYGHAAFMSRGNVPLSALVEENHRRHEPVVAEVMDKIALRAYKVRPVAPGDAARVAAVFRDTLYLTCVDRLQQSQRK